jgi:hypothetical protein
VWERYRFTPVTRITPVVAPAVAPLVIDQAFFLTRFRDLFVREETTTTEVPGQ